MSKPVNYFFPENLGDSDLLREMQYLWGSKFENIKDCQRLWMINIISDLVMNDPDIYVDHGLDEQVFDITQRIDEELDLRQKIRLILALIDQVEK